MPSFVNLPEGQIIAVGFPPAGNGKASTAPHLLTFTRKRLWKNFYIFPETALIYLIIEKFCAIFFSKILLRNYSSLSLKGIRYERGIRRTWINYYHFTWRFNRKRRFYIRRRQYLRRRTTRQVVIKNENSIYQRKRWGTFVFSPLLRYMRTYSVSPKLCVYTVKNRHGLLIKPNYKWTL